MLKHLEMDPSFTLAQQYSDTSTDPVILINLFDVAPRDHEHFTRAWAEDGAFFRAQPGYISAQLHKGIGGSSMFLNYAVFESVANFAATNRQPQFGPLRSVYPDSATARPHLFRRIAVPGICINRYV